MSDKATQLKQTVRKEVQPLLDTTLDYVYAYSEASRKFIGLKVEQAEEEAKKMGAKVTNGTATSADGSGHNKETHDGNIGNPQITVHSDSE
jgi:hypothetical protein